jgi:glycosyltransferase involved in cell wall biosynthesis
MSAQTAAAFTYSVIIPVFNSEAVVAETVDRTTAFFKNAGWRHQIILVNDGSCDRSWDVIAEKARGNQDIISINLLKNYGQHTAIFCGLRHATGDFAITLDDDLQNPPEEIAHLVSKILEGYDVVFGRFQSKRHRRHRRLGSRAIACLNRRIFDQPRDLTITNFRILRREVVERMLNYRTNFPYINGLALMFSSKRANVTVQHHPRKFGKSTYGWTGIARLVARILFNYSAFPLHFISLVGFAGAFTAFAVGAYFWLRTLFFGARVTGWASTIVLLSFFNGIIIIIVSMLGEYLIRLVKQSSESQIYHVKDVVVSSK